MVQGQFDHCDRYSLRSEKGVGISRRSLSWCEIVRQPLGRWEFLLFLGAG